MKARAYPISDDQGKQSKISKQNGSDGFKLRVATWNVGSLTGRSKELAETLKRRRVHIACVQETKWKGSKARKIGDGYTLLYHGTDSKTNGVGIIVDQEIKTRMVDIARVNDRLMRVKIAFDNEPCLNVISAYAPQVGCSEITKCEFWDNMELLLQSIPPEENTLICGDLNAHIGSQSANYPVVHGGLGYGVINGPGENLLQILEAYNHAVVNTFFKKKDEHLITYKSGTAASQIDFITCNRQILKKFKDCKVIPGEPLTTQHRLLVADLSISLNTQRKKKSVQPKIRWHKMKSCDEFVHKVQEFLALHESGTADERWTAFETFTLKTAKEILGESKGPPQGNKETWWWNSDVQVEVADKKIKFKKWQSTKSDSDLAEYKKAKSNTKRKVALAMSEASQRLYENLHTEEGEARIYKLAKQRSRDSQDGLGARYIDDERGNIITDRDKINDRWKTYFEGLLNEEFPNECNTEEIPICGPIPPIQAVEVSDAVRAMKNGKAVGPDGIPAELWKKLGDIGVRWLTSLFNAIVFEGRMPDSWRASTLIPFYKNKGNARSCCNYRGIKLTSHTLKIFERVMNSRIQDIVDLTENQCGFVRGKSTTDAIHSIRILMENYKMAKVNLHMVFIDLEKAFDRVPRKLIWDALRGRAVPESYVRVVKEMYRGVTTQVRSQCGTSDKFEVRVGVHQGSALSPLLFNIVMDYLTSEVQTQAPWTLLYADDVVLVDTDKDLLQGRLNEWMRRLEGRGLKISRTKTEHMYLNFADTDDDGGSLILDGQNLPRTEKFKYLGSVLSKDGSADADVGHRVSVGWMKWKQFTGVLCDRKMPPKLKGKLYQTVIRPSMLYGSECRSATKAQDHKLHVAEMRMLRWSAGVTLKDRVRNEHDGSADADVGHRVSVGWMKWKQFTGVLCDRKMPPKLKGKLYQTVIRPSMLYGSECRSATKAQDHKLHVAEMRMLRWSAGVTLKDRVRNEHVRGSLHVPDIHEKLTESRLRWYGHVMRRPEDHLVRRMLHPNEKRNKPGRPPTTWLSTIKRDM
uniref:Putative rna-directed dna polymerase from mobile element jockey-like diaphorina citri n=1 Tax=Lutzomyia longipalpis TaxID=7200 RepID=A0A1B0CS40_LUTLO